MRVLTWCVAGFASMLLLGCGSMHVTSDGEDSRLMLRGNDPVAYFTLGKATRGAPGIKTDNQCVT